MPGHDAPVAWVGAILKVQQAASVWDVLLGRDAITPPEVTTDAGIHNCTTESSHAWAPASVLGTRYAFLPVNYMATVRQRGPNHAQKGAMGMVVVYLYELERPTGKNQFYLPSHMLLAAERGVERIDWMEGSG